MMPKIGAHVSAAVSLDLVFDRAQEIGAQCTQIFVSPPRQWAQTKHSDAEIEQYTKKRNESGIGPNFIHGIYLINLGTQDQNQLQKSNSWLSYALNLADALGVSGVIFHPGSHGQREFKTVMPQIAQTLKLVLKYAPKEPKLILETSAGAGGGIGDSFKELGEILAQVADNRMKICLDTQHVFASGYDIKTPQGLKNVLEEFDKEIGLENLIAIHANDSKTEYNSGKDRHANIGEGFIGLEGFANLLNNPHLADLPFILEVPGFADTGPDRENISILKSLIKE